MAAWVKRRIVSFVTRNIIRGKKLSNMSEQNPYETPATDPVPVQSMENGMQLAKLGDRFVGAFIDGLVGLAVGIPLWGALFALGVIHSFAEMGNIGLTYSLLLGVVHYIINMAVQWKFLAATGQTIGKKVAKTRIATMDGKKPDVQDIVFKRYGFVSLIGLIPVVGPYLIWIDILAIFKKDRRCLHDLVAGTQVVVVNPHV